MDNNIFVGLKGKTIKVKLANFAVNAGDVIHKGVLLDVNSEFIKMELGKDIRYIRIKYITLVQED